jgi:methylmalonyl-CoA carboxyltransferase large subunit
MTSTSQLDDVVRSLAALRDEVAGLAARLNALEASSRAPPPPKPAAPVPPVKDMSEDLIAVISAAIAAYLGEKPRIRQIRLLGSASWSEQGRASIQASHSVGPRHL